jgi:amino acid transporter
MATRPPADPGVFTRASSGLVRQIRTDDVFFFGWQTIGLSYIVFTIAAWGAYPGASMELASFLAMIGGLAIGTCYALLATVYPRSGAEYVFLSRSLHPSVGFALSFNFAYWQMFYIGINGAFLSLFAISPVLAGIAVQAHSPGLLSAASWFGGHWGVFVGGSAAVLVMGYLHYRGAGLYFRWQRWATYLSIFSLVATIVVLLLALAGVFDFQANFNHLAGAGAYQKVVAAGIRAGVAPAHSFSLGQTWNFVLWPALSLWFAICAVSFSGEVKNVKRGQLIGINGSVLATGIAFIVLMALYRGVFGSSFMLSAAARGVPLKAPPYVPFFTAIAGGNVVLTIIISLWLVTIAVFVTGTTYLYPSRTLVAWSIDGMAPKWLGNVNERYHSPHWSIAVCAAVAEIMLALFAFTSLLGLASGFLGLIMNFLVVCAWSIFFPFVRRETFEGSPIAWRIRGVPVMMVIGLVATAFIVPMIYRLLVDKTFSPDLTFVYWGAAVAIGAGFLWYLAWGMYQRRRGVDLGRRYAEIPIE